MTLLPHLGASWQSAVTRARLVLAPNSGLPTLERHSTGDDRDVWHPKTLAILGDERITWYSSQELSTKVSPCVNVADIPCVECDMSLL